MNYARTALLLSLLFLGGCTVRLTYPLLEWTSYWSLGDYMELTSEQKVVAREMVADLFEGKEIATAMSILGARAELLPHAPDAQGVGSWLDGWLFAQSGPIYAGTNEVQRNILGERVLGLPKSK